MTALLFGNHVADNLVKAAPPLSHSSLSFFWPRYSRTMYSVDIILLSSSEGTGRQAASQQWQCDNIRPTEIWINVCLELFPGSVRVDVYSPLCCELTIRPTHNVHSSPGILCDTMWLVWTGIMIRTSAIIPTCNFNLIPPINASFGNMFVIIVHFTRSTRYNLQM